MRQKSNFAPGDSEEREDERQCTVMIQLESVCVSACVCLVASAFPYKAAFLWNLKCFVFSDSCPCEIIFHTGSALRVHDGHTRTC